MDSCHCCCDRDDHSFDADLLWRPASTALREMSVIDEHSTRAVFAIDGADTSGVEGMLTIVVTGGWQPIAEFVRTGFIRFETFVELDRQQLTSDDEIRVVSLGRNRRGVSLLEWPPPPQADVAASPNDVADRRFEVSVDVASDRVLATWAVSARIGQPPAVSEVLQQRLDQMLPLGRTRALAATTIGHGETRGREGVSSESDLWEVRTRVGSLSIDVITGHSAVDCTYTSPPTVYDMPSGYRPLRTRTTTVTKNRRFGAAATVRYAIRA